MRDWGGAAKLASRQRGDKNAAAFMTSLHLSPEDKQALRGAAYAFLHESVHEFERSVHRYSDRHLPTSQWKLLREHDDMRLYLQRDNAIDVPTELSTVVAMGTVPGPVGDCIYAASSPTQDQVRLRSAYVQDGLSDFITLAVMEQPSPEDPFRSMCIRWSVKKLPRPVRWFLCKRDTVVVEATGMTAFSTGESIAYNIYHSIDVPGLQKVKEYHRVEVSVVALWRHHSADRAEIYLKSFTDLKLGKATPMAVRGFANALLATCAYAETGRKKKLAYLLARRDRLQDWQDDGDSHYRRVEACTSCRKRIDHRGLHLHRRYECALCRYPVCRVCRVKKTLIRVASSEELKSYRVVLCLPCWADVARADADRIAVEETREMLEAMSAGPVEEPRMWMPFDTSALTPTQLHSGTTTSDESRLTTPLLGAFTR